MVDNFWGGLRNVFLPQTCRYCSVRTEHLPLCAGCTDALPWNHTACGGCALPMAVPDSLCPDCLQDPPPFDCAWSAFRYAEPVRQAITGLKFHAQLQQARLLGELMATRLAQRPERLPQRLIPVPLYPRRLRRRGYNQALELARGLAKRLDIPVDATAARRVRHTHEQTALSAAQRRKNLKNAFTVSPGVQGLHVALVDDVITTGTTVAELARAVRKAGAARIEVWAAARVVLG